jgi:hypothetical protein
MRHVMIVIFPTPTQTFRRVGQQPLQMPSAEHGTSGAAQCAPHETGCIDGHMGKAVLREHSFLGAVHEKEKKNTIIKN